MIRLPLLVATMLIFGNIVTAQEQCATPDDSVADPNSITKCAIEESKDTDGKKSSQISIEVSTRRRVVRKNKSAVTGLGNIGTSHQVAGLNKNALSVEKLEIASNSKKVDVMPFNIVDEVPLFPKCKDVSLLKQSKCFKEQIISHIVKNFRYPSRALTQGIGGKVLVQFVINKEGNVNIDQILMRGPQDGELLKGEAKRLISKLPKFIPGKQNGEAINVKYGVPITFRLPEGVKRTNSQRNIRPVAKNKVPSVKEKIITNAVTFSSVEEIPQFKSCSSVSDSEKLTCFNKNMVSHIQKHFYYPEAAASKNIEGRVWVNFIINKLGQVTNIKMRGPKNGADLEQEAKRMVSKLDTFIPGRHAGKAANVKYNIPITFKLSAN